MLGQNYQHLTADVNRLLASGESLAKVSKSLEIPRSTLQRIATRLGHDTARLAKRCPISLDEYADVIISAYLNGQSQSKIAAHIGCDQSNISRLLKRRGIETRFHYECNHSFFDVIDIEDKAYTLGFFTADGHNHPNGVVSIKIVDRDVLEKIKLATAYTGPIGDVPPPKRFPHRQRQYRLEIASWQMCDALTRLGCPGRKTFVTRCPTADEVPRFLLRHYIRGLFDGDGSLYECDNGWHISIAGTVALLEPLRDFISKETGITMGIYPQGKIHVMKVGGNIQVRHVAFWMYDDANIYLDRKEALYRQLMENP